MNELTTEYWDSYTILEFFYKYFVIQNFEIFGGKFLVMQFFKIKVQGLYMPITGYLCYVCVYNIAMAIAIAVLKITVGSWSVIHSKW